MSDAEEETLEPLIDVTRLEISLSSMKSTRTEGSIVHRRDRLSKGDFVPLADVPDLVWKMPSGDGSRGPRGRNPEAPNHFADMDQVPPDGSPDLLTLCKSADSNVDPGVWIDYANKFPAKTANQSAAYDMGLLPFRVWQLYDAMVDALKGKGKEQDRKVAFLCAAGTLAHYTAIAVNPCTSPTSITEIPIIL